VLAHLAQSCNYDTKDNERIIDFPEKTGQRFAKKLPKNRKKIAKNRKKSPK
jgi:hypothetical protein